MRTIIKMGIVKSQCLSGKLKIESRKMQTSTYWDSRKYKRFWLKMGVFTIWGAIIGMITDILVDAYIYRENRGLVFL